MGAYTNGLYTTTGSFESDFVEMFKELVPDPKSLKSDSTYLFEICDEKDPHIIREELGAYLIGVRYKDEEEYNSSLEKETYLDEVAKINGWKRPKWFMSTFSKILELSAFFFIEGFCVYSNQITSKLGKHNVLKIKSPFYLKAKALARGNRALDDDFAAIKKVMPENLSEQERLTFIFEFLKNHDFAI